MSGPQSMPTPSDQAAVAEARGRVYALLSNVWCYPDEALVAFLLAPSAWEQSLENLVACAPTADATLLAARELCAELSRRSPIELLEQLRASHASLFGHSVRGSCPLYELEFGRSEIIQQTAELADLSGFYGAFGMDVNPSAFERPDHLSVECEFLGVLCAKEAWGRRQGTSPLAETCFDAQRLFLRDHLARWLPAFAHRVIAADAEGFFGVFASLAFAFIADECRRFEIEAGPQWLELRPIDPATDAAIDCDTAGCRPATAEQLVQVGIEDRKARRSGE